MSIRASLVGLTRRAFLNPRNSGKLASLQTTRNSASVAKAKKSGRPKKSESEKLMELLAIRDRGLTRAQRGERKYPILCEREDRTEEQIQENKDAKYLRRHKTNPPTFETGIEIWNEIMSWKIQRRSREATLIAIRDRGLERGRTGDQKFPRFFGTLNVDEKEANDAQYLRRLAERGPPTSGYEKQLWDEIMSWKRSADDIVLQRLTEIRDSSVQRGTFPGQNETERKDYLYLRRMVPPTSGHAKNLWDEITRLSDDILKRLTEIRDSSLQRGTFPKATFKHSDDGGERRDYLFLAQMKKNNRKPTEAELAIVAQIEALKVDPQEERYQRLVDARDRIVARKRFPLIHTGDETDSDKIQERQDLIYYRYIKRKPSEREKVLLEQIESLKQLRGPTRLDKLIAARDRIKKRGSYPKRYYRHELVSDDIIQEDKDCNLLRNCRYIYDKLSKLERKVFDETETCKPVDRSRIDKFMAVRDRCVERGNIKPQLFANWDEDPEHVQERQDYLFVQMSRNKKLSDEEKAVLAQIDAFAGPDPKEAQPKRLSFSRRRRGEVMGPLLPPKRYKPPPPFKLTLESCQEAARMRGGECLSTTYKDIRTKMKWKCEKGHIWHANFTNIRHQNQWCPFCNRSSVYNIEDCKRFAELKGGKCLSDIYWNGSTRLEWECAKGHKFLATKTQVENSACWCPVCSKKLDINNAHQAAAKRGWECLSSEFESTKALMKWKCSKGHIFERTYIEVNKGHCYCYECNPEKSEVLMQAQLEAVMRGGKCLTTGNHHGSLLWQCAKGHEWNASLDEACANWCPHCSDEEAGRSRRGKIIPIHLR